MQRVACLILSLAVPACDVVTGLNDFEVAGGHGGAAGAEGGGGIGGRAAFCGDGAVDPGEECDDGNADDADGCSAGCEVVCPPDWIKLLNGHCYGKLPQGLSWEAAADACASLGTHLVTFTTMEELLIRPMFSVIGQAHWIGASQDALDGRWLWITGEEWTYMNGMPPWSPNEPTGGEPCLEMYDSSLFNDAGCDAVHAPICEREPP